MGEPTAPGTDNDANAGDSQVEAGLSAGGYALDRHVGSDTYGEVYVGLRDDDRRVVTVLSDGIIIDAVAAQRFGAEVQRISTLGAAGILATVDYDFAVQPRWIASEFVTGQLLGQRIQAAGPLSPSATRALADQLARALQGLHALSVIQRDLSPDAVLLTREGARLWHSGWAGLVDGSEYAGTVHTEHVEWLAPEQVLGEASTAASDVHAWAVTVLYAATGHNPFEASRASESVSRLIRDTPVIPALFDPVLASLIAGALSKDPTARPTSRDLLVYLDPGSALVEPMHELRPSDDSPATELSVDTVVGRGVVTEPAPDDTLTEPDIDEWDRNETESVSTYPVDDAPGALTADTVDMDVDAESESEADEGEDEEPVADGRISYLTLGLLGVIVVAVGSVVGLLVGRVLGG